MKHGAELESRDVHWILKNVNAIYIDAKDEIVVAIVSSFKPSVHDRITFIQHNILPYLW